MKNKIKYYPFVVKYPHKMLEVDFQKEPPKINQVKDGVYYIRGNQKGDFFEYWVMDNIWYLVDSNETSEYDKSVLFCEYRLFPQLSEKEWEILSNTFVYNKLSEIWKVYVQSHSLYVQLRNIRRRTTKDLMYFRKK